MSIKMKLAVLGLAMIFVFNWGAQGAEPTGSGIIERVDAMMQSEAKILQERMIIANAAGQQRIREIQAWNKRSADGDRMLVRFISPADVAGTSFLMVGDDMWLYLPALGKVRRIAGHARKGSFMGSDLSYEDMEELGSIGFASDYEAILTDTEEVAGETAYLLELLPKAKDPTYGELRMWVSQETYLPRRIEYYDPNGELLKVLTTAKVHAVDDRWVAGEMQMSNVQAGTKTILQIQDVTFQEEIPDSMFSVRNLERGR